MSVPRVRIPPSPPISATLLIADYLVQCSMVASAGPLATISCEPRQARKGAAAAADSGAGVRLALAASNHSAKGPGAARLARDGSTPVNMLP